jgi:uncharacterized tellurite resistance protein B-like protein
MTTRPRDFLAVLEDSGKQPLSVDDTGGALLLHLLVHMFFADEELHDKELALLQKLLGEDDADVLRKQVAELSGMEMNWKRLAEAFPERQDRLDILTLADHGFWGDNQMKFSEMDVLDKLAEVLEITDRSK